MYRKLPFDPLRKRSLCYLAANLPYLRLLTGVVGEVNRVDDIHVVA